MILSYLYLKCNIESNQGNLKAKFGKGVRSQEEDMRFKWTNGVCTSEYILSDIGILCYN